MKVIVFESETGFTKEYAKLLSEETGLEVYERKIAQNKFKNCDEIIYMGWLCAGSVKGLSKAKKKYNIKAVCAVGMSKDGTAQLKELKKRYSNENFKFFYLQGGFDISKLHGIYKFMMNTMSKTVGKKLAEKPDKTDEDNEMLLLLTKGGSRVNSTNLSEVVAFINN